MLCKNNEKFTYSGKEMSPLGLGYCADAENVGTQMMGRDNKNWIVGVKNNEKIWIRAPENNQLQPEKPLLNADEEKKDESVKSDEEEAKAVEKEEAKPAEKPKRKYTRKPKSNSTTVSESESDKPVEEKPTETKAEKPKRKSDNSDKKEGSDDGSDATEKSKKERKKRGPSGYNLFIGKKINEYRESEKGLKTTEYMKKAQDVWRTMGKEEQERLAAELKAEYMQNLPVSA